MYKIKYSAFTVVAVQRNKGHTNVCEQERSHTNVCEQERSYSIGFLCVLEICSVLKQNVQLKSKSKTSMLAEEIGGVSNSLNVQGARLGHWRECHIVLLLELPGSVL